MERLRGAVPILIIDTSAIVAVLQGEPPTRAIEEALASASDIEIAAATYVEIGTVLAGKAPREPRKALVQLGRGDHLAISAIA